MSKCSQKFRRALALVLAFVMAVSVLTVTPATTAEAASKKVVKKLTGVPSSKTLTVGQKATVKAKVTATKKVAKGDLQVSVKSSNKAVASVKVTKKPTKKAKSGKTQFTVTGVKAGTATITVKTKATDKKNKKVTKKIKVTVKDKTVTPGTVAVTSVNATAEKKAIVVGEATVIKASVVPANATNKTLTYSSSDSTVAAVNAQGVVTGISAGEATITVKSNNGKTATVKITVSAVDVTSVTLDQTSVELAVSNSTTLKETVLPANATNKKVTWSSKDAAIASVNENGVVTGVAVGQTEIYATAVNGARATCIVKVVNKEVVADGVSVEVTNPYKDATGKVHENTTLVGDDITLRARVMVNGAPVGKDTVTLSLTDGIGGMANKYEVRQNNLVTDDDGYVRFAVGLKDAYSEENAIYDGGSKFQSFTATVKESNSNQTASTVIKFATIELNGIEVNDVVTDVVPSDNAAKGDNGYFTTKSQDNKKNQEYLTSQQVSKKGTTDHAVTLMAAPKMIVPAALDSVREDKWVYSVPEAEGTCGDYSIYNDETNESTTVYVKDIPAGLRYLTLKFAKIDLSKYTKMDVSIYVKKDYPEVGLVKGDLLKGYEYDLAKNDSNGIQLDQQIDYESYLVVSLISQGQVEFTKTGYISQGQVESAKTGYILQEISGPYQTNNIEPFVYEEIEGSVKWEDVSKDVIYESKEWSYDEAKKYLPDSSNYLNSDFTYKYQVPVFPNSGDAIITVKDTNGTEYYFTYPSVNVDNVNVLAAAPTDKTKRVAIYAAKNEVNNLTGTLEQVGNDVVLNATATGKQFVKATITVPGLDRTELSAQNCGELYSYVGWAPTPTEEAVIPNTEYFAIEGQKVVVKAKLYDGNGNPKGDEGKTIAFKCDTGDIKLAQGTKVGAYAAVQGVSGAGTDANGELTVTFIDQTNQDKFSSIKSLEAKAEGYEVRLSFDGGVTYVPADEKSDIYWADLGLTYVDSALASDSPVRTTQFMNESKTITKGSVYTVNEESGWKIGYQVIARTPVFQYSKPEQVDRKTIAKVSEFKSISGVDVVYNADSRNAKWETKNNALVITNKVIGNIDVTGKITIADPSKVVFTYYDENGEVKTAKNIGVGDVNVTNTTLQLTTKWEPNGIFAKVLAPKYVCKNSAAAVYVRVADEYNNPVTTTKKNGVEVPTTVKCTITGVNATTNKAAVETAVPGVYKIELPKPTEAMMDEDSSIIAITVNDNDKPADTVTVMYVAQPKDANGNLISMGIVADKTNEYAVVVGQDLKTIDVYFTNTVEATTVKDGEFKLEQNGTEVAYKAVEHKVKSDKCVTITLDREIATPSATHTLTIATYTDKDGFVCELGDTAGQVIKSATYSFKPAERQ